MRLMNSVVGMILLRSGSGIQVMNSLAWYITGVIFALFLLVYLLYSLIKPEKF